MTSLASVTATRESRGGRGGNAKGGREESPPPPEERRGVLRPVSVALLSATHFLHRRESTRARVHVNASERVRMRARVVTPGKSPGEFPCARWRERE